MSDFSQIPTCLISRLTRQHVTVSLSADGGDELFGGYHSYFWSVRAWRQLGRIPAPLRSLLGGLGRLPAPAGRLIDALSARPYLAHRLMRLGELAPASDLDSFSALMAEHWPAGDFAASAPPPSPDPAFRVPAAITDPFERMQLRDALTYLPDDILVKVDRASMAVSLESRAPLLDRRVVEFAFRLPPGLKTGGSLGKLPLRRLLSRHVPKALWDRPKMGFGVPMARWLREGLRPWAEALLCERRLRESGLWDVARVRRVWSEHQRGDRDWKFRLWDVLLFEAWRESVSPSARLAPD